MIDFMLAWSSTPAKIDNIKASRNRLAKLRVVAPTYSEIWETISAPQCAVLIWGHDVPPFPPESRVRSIPDHQLLALNGWMIPSTGKGPICDLSDAEHHFAEASSAHGEYLYLCLDKNANGHVLRNLLSSVQLYSYEGDDLSLISTRPALIAEVLCRFSECSLSYDFARWVGSYAVALTPNSLFSNVNFIPQGSRIRITGGRPQIERPSGDILADAALASLYIRDRKTYWDNVFETLVGLARLVELTDLPIDFPLSGGKDSRLLLGLLSAGGYRDRIRRTYTNGPEVSPEVRSARLVAEHLRLPHQARAGRTDETDRHEITGNLPLHLFLSEGEMTPMDLMSRREPRPEFRLPGQEGGLRNIALKREIETKDQLLKWLRIHLGNGNKSGILSQAATAQNLDDIDAYVDRALAQGTPPGQVPTLHRVQYRMARWVGRVWSILNNVSFAPFLFVSDDVVRGTYNAGYKSRSLEEFHFEMLRRVSPELATIPFAGQTWDSELESLTGTAIQAGEPLHWPDDHPFFRQRETASSLKANFPSIKSYIMSSVGPIIPRLIDYSKLESFEASALESGHVAPLWQIVQLRLAEEATDFAALPEGGTFGLPDLDWLGVP